MRTSTVSLHRQICRTKFQIRVLCQIVAFACLVGGFLVYNNRTPGHHTTIISSSSSLLVEPPVSSTRLTHRRLEDEQQPQEEEEELHGNCSSATANPEWLLVFYFLGVIYTFLGIAIACDEFFVPALEEMSSERHLHLSTDVAGATLMAAGGSAPEFFSNMFGNFAANDTAIGFGTIMGSAVFNVLFVIAMCAFFAKETLTLTWWPLFRDSLYYAVGLGVLAIFFGVTSEGEIVWWEAAVLFAMYFGYIGIMYFNQAIYKKLTGKELVYPEEPDEKDNEEEDNGPVGDNILSDPVRTTVPDRGLGKHMTGYSQISVFSSVSQISLVSGNSLNLDTGLGIPSPRRNGTFRAGILRILRNPESWVDTAGLGIVAKIAGDANEVFHRIDLNNDGWIDQEELRKLFESLGFQLPDDEFVQVFETLDENKDGKISASEFHHWYVASKERILARAKEIFDRIDVDKSGTINQEELKIMLEEIYPRVQEEDLKSAISDMYQSGSLEEITFDEFSIWYQESLIYERQQKEAHEDMEGVRKSLKPPQNEGLLAWIQYIVLLPLVAMMIATIPDTQRPGMSKWCYVAFFMSIVWIGIFAYFMVDWTEVIGATIGIPSVVMGYTLVAAGTSVPDLLSSIIVARQGYGDMAVSSSIGSNIFDIMVGLPVPWLLYIVWPSKPSTVEIGSDNVLVSVLVLLGMLVFVIVSVHCQGWKLTKVLAGLMLFFYFANLGQVIGLELPFESCKH